MTTTIAPTDIVVSVEPLFSQGERTALAGVLAGYSGLHDAYALDLRMFTAWCQRHGLHVFQARTAAGLRVTRHRPGASTFAPICETMPTWS